MEILLLAFYIADGFYFGIILRFNYQDYLKIRIKNGREFWFLSNAAGKYDYMELFLTFIIRWSNMNKSEQIYRFLPIIKD